MLHQEVVKVKNGLVDQRAELLAIIILVNQEIVKSKNSLGDEIAGPLGKLVLLY